MILLLSRRVYHSHGSNPAKIEGDIIRANILEQALQTMEILSVIFNQAMKGITTAIHGKMPTKKIVLNLQPQLTKSIVIPEEY
ncbi:hypothetical protein MXB_941 [Myxobolus squamalis]|nr:hypothetical protein MXB_941 [Myxobolus squamalis]